MLKGTVPCTQQFEFNVNRISSDSLTLKINNRIFKTERSNKFFIQQYFIPGFYKVQLLDGDELLDSASFHLVTIDWLFIHPVSSAQPRVYIPMDTVKSGTMQVTREAVSRQGMELPQNNFQIYLLKI